MNLLGEMVLFAWPLITVWLFLKFKPHRAVLVGLIGGWLFLPTGVSHIFYMSGMPNYTKSVAIALGLILGGRISGKRVNSSFRLMSYDLPMIIWCVCPIVTSINNGLGLYDGLSGSFHQLVSWGVPYFAGRIYFDSSETVRDLCLGIIIGGAVYVPLCFFEIRMSPKLNLMIYGFFAHSWIQHVRNGGYRPIIFLNHGLMVATWMAVCSTVAFWFWKKRLLKHIKGIPLSLIVVSSIVATIMCKSMNGLFELTVGIGSYYFYLRKKRSPFRLYILFILFYILLRLVNVMPAETVAGIAGKFVEPERIVSLEVRLTQENLFSPKIKERPFFGWGGYDRSRPIDPRTGEIVRTVDSLWIIIASNYGLVGLCSFLSALLLGPWKLSHKALSENLPGPTVCVEALVLSLAVILFVVDSIFNGMVNPIYILVSGALVSNYLYLLRQS